MWQRMRWAQGLEILVSGFALSLGAEAQAQTPLQQQQQPVPPPSAAPSAPPASSQPATPPPAPGCFPACRTGYTCFNGACVSLCNPPCAQGESCTATGECVLQQPAPSLPAAQAASPAAYQQPYPTDPYPVHPSPDANDAGSTSTLGWLRRGPVFIARLGLSHLGSGTQTLKTTSLTNEGGFIQRETVTDEVDYAERSPMMPGFDALFHATAGLRLGASAWLLPFVSVEVDDASDSYSLGQEATIFAVLEGVIPTGAVAIVLRAQLGPSLLFVGGDLGDDNDSFLDLCKQIPVEKFTVGLGPHVGLSYGPLVGLVGGNQRVRWRFDVAAQLYSNTLGDVEVEGEGPFSTIGGEFDSFSAERDISGSRFWLMGGVEF